MYLFFMEFMGMYFIWSLWECILYDIYGNVFYMGFMGMYLYEVYGNVFMSSL